MLLVVVRILMSAKLMKMVAAHHTLNVLISLVHFAVYAEAVSNTHGIWILTNSVRFIRWGIFLL